METEVWVAAAIFVGAYVLIAADWLHKTIAALAGATLMIVAGVLTQDEAFAAIDLNVIFLLLGVTMIANVMQGTGVLQLIAVRSVRLAGADAWRLFIVLCLVTAVASAFLPNVTTVILVAPVTLYIAATLGVSPVPYLVAEILVSNIGGMATLIGDPPNILIGSAAGYDFATFAAHMAPIAFVILVAFLVLARYLFRRELGGARPDDAIVRLDESGLIGDARLMRLSVGVMAATVGGFLVAGPLGLQPATVALLGASALFVLTRRDPGETLRDVDWSTLLFFVGLFILVGGVVEAGIIRALADRLFEATGGDLRVTSLALLWVSGMASGIVDNIPYTATLIPLVEQLGERGLDLAPLWWSLALGASLGGNATLIGAASNVVIANLAERAGHPLSFWSFLRYGIAAVLLSLLLSTAYVWFRYLA